MYNHFITKENVTNIILSNQNVYTQGQQQNYNSWLASNTVQNSDFLLD